MSKSIAWRLALAIAMTCALVLSVIGVFLYRSLASELAFRDDQALLGRLEQVRALLHDSPVYIFDEATSNIDVESENDIMAQIQALAGKKTVILISHRLANVTAADNIYVLDHGSLAEQGTHEALLAKMLRLQAG